MNSSELDIHYERKIILAQHISGTLTLAVTIPVLILIITNDDNHGKHYRMYLCYLVISSLAYDQWHDNYIPIVLLNKGLIYSDSLLSHLINAALFFAIAEMMFTQIVVSYFECVYYRRSVVLTPDSLFNFSGWKRKALFSFIQVYSISANAVKLYFYHKSSIAAELSLPAELQWVKGRTTYAVVMQDENMDYANYVGNIAGCIIAVVICAMLLQLIFELKRGMNHSSVAAKQYQRLAVRALLLQGIVPSFTYVIPTCINTCFELHLFGNEEKFDRLATILSPISVLILTKHTLVNSITILCCSPSYRKKIVDVFVSIIYKIVPPARGISTMNGMTTQS